MNATTAQRTSLSDLQRQAPARAQPRTIIDYLNDDRVRKGLAAVAASILDPERVMKLVTNAVHRTPLLAQCEPKSVLGALMTSVSLGLEPNTPQGHAYLIPFKRRAQVNGRWVDVYDCQFQIGYRGFIVLGYRSKRVRSIDAEAIHANDHFKHMKGSSSFLEFSPSLQNPGEIIGAFCHSHLDEGREIATVMPIERILSVRERSETFRALSMRLLEAEQAAANAPRDQKVLKDLQKAKRNYEETPWVLRLDEMASKTAIKRHCTARLPLDPGDFLRSAVAIDNASDRGVIDLSVLADPEAARAFIADGDIPHEALHDDDQGEGDTDPGRDEQGAGNGGAPADTAHDSGAAGASPSPAQQHATAAPESHRPDGNGQAGDGSRRSRRNSGDALI